MKYIFRGHVIFEYTPDPDGMRGRVIQHKVEGVTPAFDYCFMIPEDYKLLSEFFATVYKHTQGEDVELKDINVN